jgi:drug/metabolite transporter (DMT)-like permease
MIDMEASWARLLPYALLSAVVIANVLGNIFMKLGSSVDEKHAVIFGMFGWQTLLGISFFASGVLFYGWALKQLPLYAAQSVVILQFVAVILAALVVFGERIELRQWFGITFIVIGLSLIVRQVG